jgi:hypothetical protein
MKVITYPDGDKSWAEEFDSIEDVEKELEVSADDEYRGKVMSKIRAGETHFVIANGPDTEDIWEVIP